jgi:hypothetical protein
MHGQQSKVVSVKTLREPLLMDSIEEFLAVFNQEKDTSSTLEGIPKARIARHGLPADLMTALGKQQLHHHVVSSHCRV